MDTKQIRSFNKLSDEDIIEILNNSEENIIEKDGNFYFGRKSNEVFFSNNLLDSAFFIPKEGGGMTVEFGFMGHIKGYTKEEFKNKYKEHAKTNANMKSVFENA